MTQREPSEVGLGFQDLIRMGMPPPDVGPEAQAERLEQMRRAADGAPVAVDVTPPFWGKQASSPVDDLRSLLSERPT